MVIVKKVTNGILYSCGYKFVPGISIGVKDEDAEYLKKTFSKDFEVEDVNTAEEKPKNKTTRGKNKK